MCSDAGKYTSPQHKQFHHAHNHHRPHMTKTTAATSNSTKQQPLFHKARLGAPRDIPRLATQVFDMHASIMQQYTCKPTNAAACMHNNSTCRTLPDGCCKLAASNKRNCRRPLQALAARLGACCTTICIHEEASGLIVSRQQLRHINADRVG